VETRTIRFAGNVEPMRTEHFLAGTAQAMLGQAPPAARRPHIVSPVSGAVYALDPDIPAGRQRIRFAAIGSTAGGRWRLDARDLGSADTSPAILPPPGAHRLVLMGADGRALDRVLFTVR